MNQLYSAEQAPSVVPAYHPLPPAHPSDEPASTGAALAGELRFRQLTSPSEIARVLHLRREIRLPEATLTDAGFAAREKKETRSDLWELSNSPGA